MANHQDLSGFKAVHPFAFVQSTDPALDATNLVTANKAWIDTSVLPGVLKVRDAGNASWSTVLGAGAGRPFLPFTQITGPFILTGGAFAMPVQREAFTLLTHI